MRWSAISNGWIEGGGWGGARPNPTELGRGAPPRGPPPPRAPPPPPAPALGSRRGQAAPWSAPRGASRRSLPQIEGVAFLLGRRRAILADDMGLGKTRQAIVSLRHLAPDGPSLVVCPASVKRNWAREIGVVAPDARSW